MTTHSSILAQREFHGQRWATVPGITELNTTERLTHTFIVFWPCWVFVAAQAFLQLETAEATFWLWCAGFSLWGLLSLRITGVWAQQLSLSSSRAQAQQLWCMDLFALQYMASSWTRDQMHVRCIGRWILTTGPPGEALALNILNHPHFGTYVLSVRVSLLQHAGFIQK